MAQLVLKHRGGDPHPGDIALIEGTEGLTVRDRTARALLVEASPEAARALRERLSENWIVAPETTFPPPGPV